MNAAGDPASASPRAAGWQNAAILIAIAAFQLAWFLWFMIEPLPNADNTGLPQGEKVRRAYLALKAIPEVVPGTSFRESFFGQALGELSHFENLPERVPIVLAGALLALAAIGLGDSISRRLGIAPGITLWERIALGYGLGAAILGDAALVLGRMGWLTPWSTRIGLGACALIGLTRSRLHRAPWPSLGRTGWICAALVFPFVLVMILGSMLPAVDFDVREYHLQGPKEYYQAGRIQFLPHNVYTSMPFNVEMLHLMGMELLDDWIRGALVGQLAVGLFAPAAAVLIAGAGARLASPAAGALAALVYLTTPWIYRLALIAYVEGPLCFYHAGILWTFSLGAAILPRARWSLLGLLAGGAMGCKYPGLISAVIPLGMLAVAQGIRKRTAEPLLCLFVGWAIVMGPWLVKNVIDTGNPVYPLADRVFHSSQWDQEREAKWNRVHGPRPIRLHDFWLSVVDVAGRSDWQSSLYVAFGVFALARPGSRKAAAWLLGYAFYLFLTWWLLTHRLDRFWLPILPVLAVLAGLGADWRTDRGWAIVRGSVVALALIANFAYVSSALAGLNEWTANLSRLRDSLNRKLTPSLAELDEILPANARILVVGQAAVFHMKHPVIYNTVFDREWIEMLGKSATPAQLKERLHALGVTHVFVDWKEIERYRQPGNYGFTDYVQPERFEEWTAAGVLQGPRWIGSDQRLYTVR